MWCSKNNTCFPNDKPLRITELENITKGWRRTSRDEGIVMSKSSLIYKDPIFGKITYSRIEGNNVTSFTIEEGIYENHVFIHAGQIQRAQIIIIDILKRELDSYVKIWDNYISPDTIKLLLNVPNGIDILFLLRTLMKRHKLNKRY
jgi:hypothetical protein